MAAPASLLPVASLVETKGTYEAPRPPPPWGAEGRAVNYSYAARRLTSPWEAPSLAWLSQFSCLLSALPVHSLPGRDRTAVLARPPLLLQNIPLLTPPSPLHSLNIIAQGSPGLTPWGCGRPPMGFPGSRLHPQMLSLPRCCQGNPHSHKSEQVPVTPGTPCCVPPPGTTQTKTQGPFPHIADTYTVIIGQA